MTSPPIRLTVCAPADGATNFARDDALMAFARATGGEAWRLYSWRAPTASFGRNERAAGRFSADRLAAAGIDAVRRVTGGRVLMHARELTYAAAGPVGSGDTLSAAYRRITAVVAGALRRVGVATAIADARFARGARGSSGADSEVADPPCFAQPSVGEIVVGESKLVASAQFRDGSAFLQHGSILIDDDQPLLAGGLVPGAAFPPLPNPATLRALLGRALTLEELAAALNAELSAVSDVPAMRVDAAQMLEERTVRERVAHYRDPAWTWRR